MVCVAGFDKEQAETALRILSQSPALRREYASKLRQVLTQVNPLQQVMCTPRSAGGLITSSPVSLPYRAAFLLAEACLIGNEAGVELLKEDLGRIAAGLMEPGEIRKPFLVSEGIAGGFKG